MPAVAGVERWLQVNLGCLLACPDAACIAMRYGNIKGVVRCAGSGCLLGCLWKSMIRSTVCRP